MNSLTEDEKDRLVEAMNRLIDSGRYADGVANIHGGPTEICPDKGEQGDLDHRMCCGHGNTLLPWHRLYMVQVEGQLVYICVFVSIQPAR